MIEKTKPFRSYNFQIRLSPDEWIAIQDKATMKPISKWARSVLLDKPIDERKKNEVVHSYPPELLRELQKISVNVNQIAKALNTSNKFNHSLQANDFLRMAISLHNISSSLREVLDRDYQIVES